MRHPHGGGPWFDCQMIASCRQLGAGPLNFILGSVKWKCAHCPGSQNNPKRVVFYETAVIGWALCSAHIVEASGPSESRLAERMWSQRVVGSAGRRGSPGVAWPWPPHWSWLCFWSLAALCDMHPMRALFLIPRNPAPRLKSKKWWVCSSVFWRRSEGEIFPSFSFGWAPIPRTCWWDETNMHWDLLAGFPYAVTHLNWDWAPNIGRASLILIASR